MSDPQRPPGVHPRRAEPLQPDKPGSGDRAQEDDGASSKAASDSLRKATEQEEAAVDNVRKGYA